MQSNDNEYDWSVWICKDCGKNTLHEDHDNNYYMVTHELWNQYGCGDGMLCWGCMETRIGRPITAADLLPCPLNSMFNPRAMKLLKTKNHEPTT